MRSIATLKEALAGAKVSDLVRKHGISEHTFRALVLVSAGSDAEPGTPRGTRAPVSAGETALRASMKVPRCESSSSPIG